jgi:hypothetical protein
MRKQLLRSAFIIALLTIIGTMFSTAQAAPTPAVTATPGELDPTFAGFGTGGVVTPGGLRSITGMAVQPDGKVVVAGVASSGTYQLAVHRFLPNGAFDGTFGKSGKAIFPNMFIAQDNDADLERRARRLHHHR